MSKRRTKKTLRSKRAKRSSIRTKSNSQKVEKDDGKKKN